VEAAIAINTLPVSIDSIGSLTSDICGINLMNTGKRAAPRRVLKNASFPRKIRAARSSTAFAVSMVIKRSNPNRVSKIIASPVIPPAAIECGPRNRLTATAIKAIDSIIYAILLIRFNIIMTMPFFFQVTKQP
jgi:hypothetical protein